MKCLHSDLSIQRHCRTPAETVVGSQGHTAEEHVGRSGAPIPVQAADREHTLPIVGPGFHPAGLVSRGVGTRPSVPYTSLPQISEGSVRVDNQMLREGACELTTVFPGMDLALVPSQELRQSLVLFGHGGGFRLGWGLLLQQSFPFSNSGTTARVEI